MRLICKFCHLFFLCLWALFFSLTSYAAALSVSPTGVSLDARETTGSVQLGNKGDKTVVVQISVVKWTQQNGKDVYTKTEDILVSPPILSVAPRDSQILRVGLVSPQNPIEEAAYRMFIKEVPKKVKRSPGIHTILQLSLPVFVKPAKENSNLQWAAHKTGQQNLSIRLVNSGNVHARIAKFALYQPSQAKPFFTKSVFNYVLPRQSATWNFKLAQPINSSSLKMLVTTDRGEISENVVLVSP